ncbi:OsmC family peroxiredoxin [Flavobacterium sp. P4023]|uniref:OsmC family peroxiredoxin n=1 Tax=Flavobacterium flabelliforme TaxID=2816119 RepID=A0ABS5CWM4_9FLAO|nr:OsmC family peroxiredoxin [Flavobacterium flabelliforme]MBP4143019.1 OsmC family peroxiredoxin [Flavobacterium flabelliforme]
MKRNATAVWNGSLKEGAGKLTTQTTTLKDSQYSFKSRFEEGVGTNPEELIAAAHAGCYTMQLTAYLSEDGFKVESIESKCDIDLQEGTIVTSHITIHAKIKDIAEDVFQQYVTKAEKNCPVSKVLNAAISTTATLA